MIDSFTHELAEIRRVSAVTMVWKFDKLASWMNRAM